MAGHKTFDAIAAGLVKKGLAVHKINDLIPGYTEDPESFEISIYDKHPNARAHDAIADYIVEEILRTHPATKPACGIH